MLGQDILWVNIVSEIDFEEPSEPTERNNADCTCQNSFSGKSLETSENFIKKTNDVSAILMSRRSQREIRECNRATPFFTDTYIYKYVSCNSIRIYSFILPRASERPHSRMQFSFPKKWLVQWMFVPLNFFMHSWVERERKKTPFF